MLRRRSRGHVADVVAVDPQPDMLDEGRRAAAERDAANIDWRLGDSSQLEEMNLGRFDLATMGASYHWMDRDAVLVELDKLIEPGGAVVVTSGGAPGSHTPPPWSQTITDVRIKWLGPRRRAGSSTYTHPDEGHAAVLRRSPFAHVETMTWTRTIERGLDEIVGLQFSFSFCAPALLGDDKDAFEANLRQALTDVNPPRWFVEHVHTEALIATRP